MEDGLEASYNDGNRAQSDKTNEAPVSKQQVREPSDSAVIESNTQTTVVDSNLTNGVKVYPGRHCKPPDLFM